MPWYLQNIYWSPPHCFLLTSGRDKNLPRKTSTNSTASSTSDVSYRSNPDVPSYSSNTNMSSQISSMFYGVVIHNKWWMLLAVEFVEVLRGKFCWKAFLLVSLSVLLRMLDIFLCLSSLNVE
jgi:hypothetical protein